MGSIGNHLAPFGPNGLQLDFSWAPVGFYLAQITSIGLHLAVMGSNELQWAPVAQMWSIGLKWVQLGSSGHQWALLGTFVFLKMSMEIPKGL